VPRGLADQLRETLTVPTRFYAIHDRDTGPHWGRRRCGSATGCAQVSASASASSGT